MSIAASASAACFDIIPAPLEYFGHTSFNLDSAGSQSFAFGQPTQRTTQVVGSGGPRVVQVGGRITF